MTLQFDDVLSAICTEVKPAHANDQQKIYLLTTGIEAKLAFDLLIAFGFNAKVYHTPDKPSKLYISNPKVSAEQVELQLSSALAYARALKHVVSGLNELCATRLQLANATGYTVAFVNAQPSGKQVLIQISNEAATATASAAAPAAATEAAPPAAATETAAADTVAAAGTAPAAAAQSAAKISAYDKRVMKKTKKVQKEDELTAGPAVGRTLYPKKIMEEGGGKETLRKRIMLRMFGNFATSGYFALMWLVIAGVTFSFFVFAKGWLCYDFVAKKSNKWYCQDQGQMTAEEAQKKEREEKAKKLGLQPIDTPQQ